MKVIYSNGTVGECSPEEELHIIRHTAAHIMAQAIKRLYPDAKFAYGPANEKGFYYDVDLGDVKLTDDDLEAIEAEMKKIVKENLPIKPSILPREEAIKFMEEKNEPYKVELIKDLPEDAVISFYSQGEFVDLCAGPHLMNTKAIKAFTTPPIILPATVMVNPNILPTPFFKKPPRLPMILSQLNSILLRSANHASISG